MSLGCAFFLWHWQVGPGCVEVIDFDVVALGKLGQEGVGDGDRGCLLGEDLLDGWANLGVNLEVYSGGVVRARVGGLR